MPEISEVHSQAMSLEKQAYQLRGSGKVNEAFEAYDKAGELYSREGEALKAAVCYASAATCWNILSGQQTLTQAATRSHLAATEALKARHYDYARTLFHSAALLYEKEGDLENFSVCFYRSQRAKGRHAWETLTHSTTADGERVSLGRRLEALFDWFVNVLSYFIWGYGERPARTIYTALLLIFGAALLYLIPGGVQHEGVVRQLRFPEALYFSLNTFTTVGFGDYLPLHGARVVASLESTFGIILTPLFLVGLTRKYLRISR